MRYQLPVGVASVSVQGLSFVADEDGQITVPDGLPPEVYQDLESQHHHNLKGVTEPVPGAAIEVAGDPLAEKRLLRELLRMHGVAIDGRATLSYLRGLVVDTLDERTGEQPDVAGQLTDPKIAELADEASSGGDAPAVAVEQPDVAIAASGGGGSRARRGKAAGTADAPPATGTITTAELAE